MATTSASKHHRTFPRIPPFIFNLDRDRCEQSSNSDRIAATLRTSLHNCLLLILSLASIACGESSTVGPSDSSGTSSEAAAARVELAPESAQVAEGETLAFDARVIDSSGNEVSGFDFSWSTTDSQVATVDEGGLLAALAEGNVEVTVTATDPDVRGRSFRNAARLEVASRSLASVSISPEATTLDIGTSVQFTTDLADGHGDAVDGSVEWESTDSSVVEVDDSGVAVGLDEGQASIVARSDSQADTARVTVETTSIYSLEISPDSLRLEEEQALEFDVTVENEAGERLDRRVSWRSSDTTIATVDSTGAVLARQIPGESTIVAMSGGVVDSAHVVVEGADQLTPEMPSSVSISEMNRSATTIEYRADWSRSERAEDYAWTAGSNDGSWSDSGSGIVETEVGFEAPRRSSTNDSFYCVSGRNDSGESEQRCNAFTVSALEQDDSDATTVEVSPASIELEVGSATQVSALVLDGSGDEMDQSVSWSSVDSEIATVDATGIVQGIAEGTTRVVGHSDGVADTTTVEIVATQLDEDELVFEEDFGTYGSTSELLSDPRGIYGIDTNEQDIALDTSEGLSGGRSMRYDFSAQSQCGNYTIRRSLDLPGLVGEGYTEVWLEIRAKFSRNFHAGEPNNGGVGLSDVSGSFQLGESVEFSGGLAATVRGVQSQAAGDGTEDEVYLTLAQIPSQQGPAQGEAATGQSSGATGTVATEHMGCSTNSDYKWLILWGNGSDGSKRFSMKHGESGNMTTSTYPGNDFSRDLELPSTGEKFNSVEDFFDGEWHTVRMHLALEDPVNSGANNGISRIWVDGKMVQDWTDLDTRDHTALRGLALGANRNAPANELMSVWWDSIRVWSHNPGW